MTADNQSAQFPQNERKDYGSAKAYAAEVSKWCEYSKWWMSYQQFSQQMSHNYATLATWNAQLTQQQQMQAAASTQSPDRRIIFRINLPRLMRFLPRNPNAPHQTLIVQQYAIPSLVRRITAEAIDCCLLFLFKLIALYLLFEFEFVDIDQFDDIFKAGTDINALLNVTQDLFNIEVFCKIIAALFEALCISHGFMNYPRGTTPGKYVMRIAVISCVDVQPVPGHADRVTVTGLPVVDVKSSLIRSFLKNVVMMLLLPLSAAFYIFQHNRAAYDIAAKTIVVSV